jgi:DNA processing protein
MFFPSPLTVGGRVAKRIGFVSPIVAPRTVLTELQSGAPGFPERVARALPAVDRLWLRGAWPWSGAAVAVVGARAASARAREVARQLGEGLAMAGVRVVSGGAVGVDASAHQGALAAGGPGRTAAVLAPGLDDPYPAHHRPLYERIVDEGGTLLSAVPPGTPIQRWHFPARNQVMAALVDAVVIVECRVGSGTMTTARAAAALGRRVAAVPGSPGTEALIGRGAAAVTGAAAVLALLAGDAPAAATGAALAAEDLPPPDSDEGRALAALDAAQARAPEVVGEAAGLAPLAVVRALTALELMGLALPAPGGRYLRAAHAA